MHDEILEKKKDFELAQIMLTNIIEAEKIERFKFTPQEMTALLFVHDLVSAHIKELDQV
jgi:hypothetical protein